MRNSFLLLALAATLSVSATDVTPTFTEWQDLQVNAVNRFPLHTQFFAYENRDLALKGAKTESSNFLSLDGKWKFKFVENADQRPTDFYKTDLDDSTWGEINVPGMWELQGYGEPISTWDMSGAVISRTTRPIPPTSAITWVHTAASSPSPPTGTASR